jgi:hypothetical protein
MLGGSGVAGSRGRDGGRKGADDHGSQAGDTGWDQGEGRGVDGAAHSADVPTAWTWVGF